MLSVLHSKFYHRVLRDGFDSIRVTNVPVCFRNASASPCQPHNPPPKGCGGGSGTGPAAPSQSDSRCKAPGGKAGGGGGKHTITYKPYVAPVYQDHDHKNMGLNRPMSPHLTIYAPSVPTMTSISQRISGIILTVFASVISGGTLFLSNGIDSIVSIIQSLDLSRPLLFLLKIIIGLPFAYHYFFGIRFIAWNAGKWLNMKAVYGSAKSMGIAALVTTLLFALL